MSTKLWTPIQAGRFHLRNIKKGETLDQYVTRVFPTIPSPAIRAAYKKEVRAGLKLAKAESRKIKQENKREERKERWTVADKTADHVLRRLFKMEPVPRGEVAQWCACKECGMVQRYHYVPYGLGCPIHVLACGHGAAQRFDDIIIRLTPNEALRRHKQFVRDYEAYRRNVARRFKVGVRVTRDPDGLGTVVGNEGSVENRHKPYNRRLIGVKFDDGGSDWFMADEIHRTVKPPCSKKTTAGKQSRPRSQ